MRLEIEGFNKLSGITDRQLSILYCSTQKDLYAIEFMYNNDVENTIFYFIIMRNNNDGYQAYFINHTKGTAFPVKLQAFDIKTKDLMMGFLRSMSNSFFEGKLLGSHISTYNDLKNLVFG